MNDEKLNRLAAAYEEVVAKQLRKLKYSVRRLDFQKESARPDFLVSNSSGAQMLCEVKAIFSAGYKSDKGVHVSMLDEKLSNFGVFETKIDRTKLTTACRTPSVSAWLWSKTAQSSHVCLS